LNTKTLILYNEMSLIINLVRNVPDDEVKLWDGEHNDSKQGRNGTANDWWKHRLQHHYCTSATRRADRR